MKLISLTVLVLALAQIPAEAQWHSAATPPPTVDSTPIPSMSGTLTTITPGDSVSGDTVGLKTSSTVELTFRLAKALVVVGVDGKVVFPPTVPLGDSVTVHFMHDGDEFVIDRIFLQ